MKLILFFITLIIFLPLKVVWSQPVQLALEVPVIINGEQLPQLQGKELQNLRVFSFNNGQASIIPFQIDQRNSNGDWVWEVAQKNGNTHDNEDPGNSNVFDHNDQLLFMATDLGEQSPLSSHSLLASDSVLEVQINAPNSNQVLGWAYIAYYGSNPPPLSTKRYMTYHPEQLQIQSPIYQMAYSDDFIAVMDHLSINDAELIDRLKIRGEVEVGFLFFSTTIDFTEEEVDGYPAGYINGPIRTIKRVVNYVALGAGMRSPSLNCDHFYYPKHAEIPILLSRSFGVKNMSLRIGLDFHNTTFERLYADGLKGGQYLQSNSIENRLVGLQAAQWQVLSGSSYSLFSSLRVPEAIQHLLVVSPYIIYNSDSIDLPEHFSGAEPESGFILKTKKDFPPGEHILYMTYVLSTEPYKIGNGEKINQLLSKPLKIIAKSMPLQ